MIYRFTDQSMKRAYDIHPDGRKFGFYKNFKYEFAIVESVDGNTTIINPGDHDYDITMMKPEETGDVTLAGIMDEAQLGMWCVAAFFELFIWPQAMAMNDAAIARHVSDDERIVILACCLDSFNVTDSMQIATNFVNDDIKPSFRNLGMNDVPDSYKKILES